MTEGIKKANPPSTKDNENSSSGNSKKKSKGEKFPTKVVVRKLPPSMNLETFLENVSPLPETDYINFVPADNSLFPYNYCKAYINFINHEDLLIFTQKFDGYVFVDIKGHEYPAVVEFAPFQRIPKARSGKKKDSKCGTLENDPHYIKFKERLQAEDEEIESGNKNVFETTLPEPVPEKVTSTPLLDFLRKRREEKKRIREEKKEERKRRELERRKAKDELRKAKKAAPPPPSAPSDAAETSESSAPGSSVASKDKEKVKDKELFGKRGAKDLLKAIKVKEKLNTAPKEKEKVGKSYREERMRRIEQREELRRKNSKTSDTSENAQQESSNKDRKTSDPSVNGASEDRPEDKYKKQKIKVDSYQKNKRKDFDKRSSEYYKSGLKNKDFPNDRTKKKIVIAQKPQDNSSNVSENKENNSNCDKSGKKDEANATSETKYEKQSTKSKSGSQKDSAGNSEAVKENSDKRIRPVKESGAVPKRRQSLETHSKQSNSFVKKKEDEKVGNSVKQPREDSKKVVNKSTEAASKSSEKEQDSKSEKHVEDKKKISKSETLTRRNTLEEESATSPVATPERRKSLESQDSATTQDSKSQSKKDPRTERRIRNKDRPAMEIYRPGMGKFSRSRLEKVLGSSTERDTPSPSPSITSN